MTRVLVTGASGFVGSAVCEALAASGYAVRAALRAPHEMPAAASDTAIVGDLAVARDFSAALENVDAVIHCAARAHVLNDSPRNADVYDQVNVQATVRLAEATAQAGIRRFVFVSSVKVNGEETTDHAFGPDDAPRPGDPYGLSKWLAERELRDLSARTGLEVAIVRPPLVYGPGVRANFLRLLRWVDAEWPLPFGAICNARSLVSVWNLASLLVAVFEKPAAAGGLWMVSDGMDLSTPELIRHIGQALGRRVSLPRVAPWLLTWCGAALGKQAEVRRLCGSLTVNIEQTRDLLDWSPPISVDDSLARTAVWFRRAGMQGQP